MQTDIYTLKDLFQISYDTFIDSRKEAAEILDFYHNRQYTDSQLQVLKDRGQPAETFNIIKLFGRLILGYYSTVVNTITVNPVQINDILTASLLNDTVDFTMRDNQFETEGDKIKLDALLQGLMCTYADVEDTDEKDIFGRTIKRVTLSHVPAQEIAPDPMSKLEDYSDARYIHRYKWMSEDAIIKLFKDDVPNIKEVLESLQDHFNHLNIDEAEFAYEYNGQFDGMYKRYNNYLIVHTIIEDDDGKKWSIYWCDTTEILRKEVTYKEVSSPYRLHKVHTSNKAEYYGIFREVLESQKAVNQALLKIQLMANTQKAFIEDGGVENIAEFAKQFNRVNAIIPVKRLSKIKIENLTKEIVDQYTIIDKAFDRIQRVLGVNDSFLGMAFASDSGRKVKLQQNATTMSLRYITVRLEQFYRLLGWDIVNLIKQYYTAYQVLRISDEVVGQRWIQLNQPMVEWTGKMDANGQPIMDFVYEEVLDPASGEPELDENGNIIMAPIPTAETEIAFTKVDLKIDTVIYNDEDEKNQLMLESILQGNIGNTLMQVNPGGYFRAASLAVRSMKSKHSLDIANILEQTGAMIMGMPGLMPPQEGQPGTTDTKLPQNTNEGV